MTPEEFLKDKKVLVVILGIYGGGAATAKWLFHHGAKVTVTDMRTEEELANSMKLFTEEERAGIRFVLGGQRDEDFISNDIIVVGPGVPEDSPYLAVARKAGKRIENDASLFFRFVKNPVIAVTGTRGKSTTTSWIAHLLSEKYGVFVPTGNNPEQAFLKELCELKDESRPVVAEMSSWQLERLPYSETAPHIAVITNLFPDHLNRYKDGIKGYAEAKANIFKEQRAGDFLILNAKNEWTSFFVEKVSGPEVFFFSLKPLPKGKNGIFIKNGVAVFWQNGIETEIVHTEKFVEEKGAHNTENLLAALLAIKLFDPSFRITEKKILDLPSVPFREEVIFEKGGLTVVNDSAGTSPDAVIAALRRFAKKDSTFIVGGTDKQLEFGELAKEIKKKLKPEQIVFLNGSATRKLIAELKKVGFFKRKKILLFETLEDCIEIALGTFPEKKGTLVFSPGAASFEKFLNEFDRDRKFSGTLLDIIGKR